MRILHDLWHNGAGRAGVVLLIGLGLLVLVGPLLVGDPDSTNYRAQLQAPGGEHWFGTDQAGRDLFARFVSGGETSLGAALLVFIVTSGIGMITGVAAGMLGGIMDVGISRLIDVMLSLPSQVLALAIVGLLGPGFVNLVLAMSLTGWASLAKLARACALGSSHEPYVQAALLAGVPQWRILVGHVVPAVWSQVMVLATLHIGSTILTLSGLSFLGLGAQPPTAEWGSMLSQARSTVAVAPWQLIGPALGLFWSMASVTLLADALREVTGVDRDVS